jgi:ABC-2 type transport system permease protein
LATRGGGSFADPIAGARALPRTIIEEASLYFRLLGAQVRSQLQYRASFALQAFAQSTSTVVDFGATVLLFQRFPTMDGWSLGEVAFLCGLGGVAFAISDMVCGGFDHLSIAIQTGTFDRVLTRPVGTFLQTLASDFQLRRVGRIAQAALVFAISLVWVEIDWTPLKLLVLLSALVSGVVIFGAIWVIGAAITFWTVQTSEVTNVFTYGGSEMVTRPMSIYADWLRRFFTFVVPLAFVAYLPALYILGRPDPLGLPPLLQLGSPLVALLFFLPAYAAWSFGVQHYQSTGS